MGFDLSTILSGVSDFNTERKQIEYIDIAKLHPDERNKYELSDIDGLVSNIELFGLQQPIEVRPHESQDGEYTITSGHRRHAALTQLIADGHDELREVPCIVVHDTGSAALQELRLIYANSDTRRMSPAEQAWQAERVKDLLYELKEQGYEFPGRVRDHVAEACKISKSKLARLEAIENRLAPDIKKAYWSKGNLTEDAAYQLSKLSYDWQRSCIDIMKNSGRQIQHVYAGSWRNMADVISRLETLKCPQDICGGKCIHMHGIVEKLFKTGYRSYDYCSYNGCCATCKDIATCKSVCLRMKDAAKAAKDERRLEKKKEDAALAAKDAPAIEQIQALWSRFSTLRQASGLSIEDFYDKADLFYCPSETEKLQQLDAGTYKVERATVLPFGSFFSLSSVQQLIRCADTLGCSIDYMLCRSEADDDGNTVEWHEGEPKQEGKYYCKLEVQGSTFMTFLNWSGAEWLMVDSKPIDNECTVLGWWPIPEG